MVSVAIGTETAGSNVWPASLNGIYGLTLSHGSVPTSGVFRISETFDRIGLMAADPTLLSALTGIVQGRTVDRSLSPIKAGIALCDWGVKEEEGFAKKKWTLSETVSYISARTPRRLILSSRSKHMRSRWKTFASTVRKWYTLWKCRIPLC